MNFDFSDDARELQAQARRFFDAEAGPDAARRVMNGEEPYDKKMWRGVVDLGLPALRVPEDHGGLGLGAEEACLIAEEAGRSLAAVPLMSTMIFTEALLLAGHCVCVSPSAVSPSSSPKAAVSRPAAESAAKVRRAVR